MSTGKLKLTGYHAKSYNFPDHAIILKLNLNLTVPYNIESIRGTECKQIQGFDVIMKQCSCSYEGSDRNITLTDHNS